MIDHGRILRLGPIREGALGAEMEVAWYDRLEVARRPRVYRWSGSSSWGVYTRE